MENSFPGEGTCLRIHVVYLAEEVGNFPTLGDGNAKLTVTPLPLPLSLCHHVLFLRTSCG